MNNRFKNIIHKIEVLLSSPTDLWLWRVIAPSLLAGSCFRSRRVQGFNQTVLRSIGSPHSLNLPGTLFPSNVSQPGETADFTSSFRIFKFVS